MNDWIKYGNNFASLSYDDLCIPGYLIEVKQVGKGSFVSKHVKRDRWKTDPQQFLIGDINSEGGSCDNFQDIDYGDEVIRYQMVYDKEKETDEGWIVCKKSFNFGNFVDSNLNIAGTMIEVLKLKEKITKQYLIGDVDENGGRDNHCREVEDGDKILRYKVVWKKKR